MRWSLDASLGEAFGTQCLPWAQLPVCLSWEYSSCLSVCLFVSHLHLTAMVIRLPGVEQGVHQCSGSQGPLHPHHLARALHCELWHCGTHVLTNACLTFKLCVMSCRCIVLCRLAPTATTSSPHWTTPCRSGHRPTWRSSIIPARGRSVWLRQVVLNVVTLMLLSLPLTSTTTITNYHWVWLKSFFCVNCADLHLYSP